MLTLLMSQMMTNVNQYIHSALSSLDGHGTPAKPNHSEEEEEEEEEEEGEADYSDDDQDALSESYESEHDDKGSKKTKSFQDIPQSSSRSSTSAQERPKQMHNVPQKCPVKMSPPTSRATEDAQAGPKRNRSAAAVRELASLGNFFPTDVPESTFRKPKPRVVNQDADESSNKKNGGGAARNISPTPKRSSAKKSAAAASQQDPLHDEQSASEGENDSDHEAQNVQKKSTTTAPKRTSGAKAAGRTKRTAARNDVESTVPEEVNRPTTSTKKRGRPPKTATDEVHVVDLEDAALAPPAPKRYKRRPTPVHDDEAFSYEAMKRECASALETMRHAVDMAEFSHAQDPLMIGQIRAIYRDAVARLVTTAVFVPTKN